MYGKFVGFVYYTNIVIQSVLSLLCPVALLTALAWYLVEKQGLPEWVYVPAILLGTVSGLFSMVKYVISATRAAEALAKERQMAEKKKTDGGADKSSNGKPSHGGKE